MDELDRKLKAVQLQREQLALERDLARARSKERIVAGPRAVLSSVAAFAGAAIAWWKPISLIAMVSLAALGVVAWQEQVKKQEAYEREMVEREEHYKRLSARVEKKCGRLCRHAEGGDFVSTNGGACVQTPGFSHVWCRVQVERGFD